MYALLKLYAVKCPECGATLEIDDGMKFCFCKYCGNKIVIDDEQQVITINKNVRIEQTNRRIDEAALAREAYKDKKDRRDNVVFFLCMLCLFAIILGCVLPGWVKEKVAESNGEVSVGFYRDLIGEDYKTVVAHFESAGFENIEVIDLDDSGILFWKEGKVEIISVEGNTSFDSYDYFSTDAKVVISHH